MKKQKLIGVVPLWDAARESIWMLPGYLEGIERAGGIPVILPLTTEAAVLAQLADTVDGFLFTGGQDVSPALYNAEPSPQCGETCPERDEMERILFRLAWEQDKAAFGICRGIQLLNVLLGGTLFQHLPEEHPSLLEHHQAPPYDVPCHTVELLADTPLRRLLGTERLRVNSYHHQAVKTLAPGLQPMAVSEDGLVEAFCAPEKRFFWAVQWHPEFSYQTDENSQKLFDAFVHAC